MPASAGNCAEQRVDQLGKADALRRLDHDHIAGPRPCRATTGFSSSAPSRYSTLAPLRQRIGERLHLRAGEQTRCRCRVPSTSSASAGMQLRPNARRVPACRRARRCAARRPSTGVASSSAMRRLHRGRIGVVALVDQRDRAACDAAAGGAGHGRFRRDSVGQRQRDLARRRRRPGRRRPARRARSARYAGPARRCARRLPCPPILAEISE